MKHETERRYSEGLTLDKRTLSGLAMPYGQVGKPGGGKPRERFAPGAFGEPGDVMLNVMHRRDRPLARTGDGGLELADDGKALAVRATLPKTRDADDTLALVKSGVLRGLSVEFRATKEHREAGIRVIDKADLLAIAVVDKPAYEGATVDARQADTEQPAPLAWWLL